MFLTDFTRYLRSPLYNSLISGAFHADSLSEHATDEEIGALFMAQDIFRYAYLRCMKCKDVGDVPYVEHFQGSPQFSVLLEWTSKSILPPTWPRRLQNCAWHRAKTAGVHLSMSTNFWVISIEIANSDSRCHAPGGNVGQSDVPREKS